MATPVNQIHGIYAASKEEIFVANSLTRFGWDFVYQQPFFFGRSVAGGFVVDFIVFTVPLPTPLWVNGEYWHSGAQAERDSFLQSLFGSRIRGYNPPVTVWGEDLETQEETDKKILELFGRAY